MAENQASTALSDDDLAAVTGGKGTLDTGSAPSPTDGMSLEEMVKAVQQERMNQIDELIKSSVADIKAQHETIRELNQGLSVLSTAEKGLEAQGPGAQVSVDSLAAAGGYRTAEEFTKALDLPANAVQDGQLGKEELQSAITGVKAQIDTANSENQLEQVRLLSLMNKRDQATDALTDMLSKGGKSLPPWPPGNMR